MPALRHVLLAELHPGIMFFALLTPGEQDSVEFEAASILQPTGELIEVTAVQVKGDPQGMPGALHLVTHWCVCNKQTEMREKLKKTKQKRRRRALLENENVQSVFHYILRHLDIVY